MKHWHLGLLAAATAFFVTSPAQAAPDFRVIRWDFTRICQIYDFGWGGRPIPSNYRVMTPPLPNFRAAVRAKGSLARSILRGHILQDARGAAYDFVP
jgi:hypothetical protein